MTARAEAALRDSEALYRTLFDAIDEGLAVVEMIYDRDGEIVDMIYRQINSAYERHGGVYNVVGRSIFDVIPGVEEHWLAPYKEVARTGVAQRVQNYQQDVDRWFDVHFSRVDKAGRYVTIVFNDVTNIKRAELGLRASQERQAFLLALSDTVRPIAGAADIQGETTRLLRQKLNAAWCYYVDWDLDRQTGLVLRDSAREGLQSLAGAHDASDVPEFLQLLAEGAVLTVRDYANYNELSTRIRHKFAAVGFRAMMAAPLVKEGRLIATMVVGDTAVRDWSASEATLLVDVADRTWAAVERARAEAALRESEELRRIAVTGGRMGTWRWDLLDKLIWGDATFLGLWGFPFSEEPRSLADFTDRMTPQGQAEMGELITRAIAAGETFDGQLAVVGGPTSGHRVRWRGRVEAERPWIINGVSFDVTEQWLAEERLRESEQALASDLANAELLRSLSERLVPEESFQAIYDEILSATVAITRADAGTVQLYDPAAKSLELIASLNFSRTITDYFHRVDAGSRTACGTALETGERAFVDFPDEVADLGCRLLTGEGIQSAVAFPLVSRTGAPLGMLNAHWRQSRHRLNERELRFLDLLARQAADLIERRQGERALRESEARLREFGEASQDVLWVRDAESLRWTYLTPAFETV